jgi:hypothetical protein
MLAGTWMNIKAPVIAIGAATLGSGIAIVIQVKAARRTVTRVIAVDEVVAIIVQAVVAMLASTRVAIGIIVVAIRGRAVTVAIHIAAAGGTQRIIAIAEPIAVVVECVAAIFAGVGIDEGKLIVAILAGRAGICDERISIVIGRIGGQAIAVVVHRIALDLPGAWVDQRIAIVTVGATTSQSGIAVAIRVNTPRWTILDVVAVDQAVTVVVDAIVTILRRTGIDARIAIIAVVAAA